MKLRDLPLEVLEQILTLAISIHPSPRNVILVNRTFHDIGIHFLYTRLRFKTIRQLSLFSQTPSLVPYLPQEVTVTLSGGTADFQVFHYLAGVFKKCISDGISEQHFSNLADSPVALPMDRLYLRLNSHMSNPNLHQIYDALVLAK